MSGDIDIEEHDLMDNPRVRTIFPDLTLLKKEIVDADHEEIQKPVTPSTSKKAGLVNHEKNSITNYSVITEEFTPEANLKRQDTRPTVQKSKYSLLNSNLIVFGTKPSLTSDKKLKFKVKINLEDINCTLKKSKCYCRICKTLFPKLKVFEEHNILNHKYTFSNRDSVGGQEDNVKDNQTSEGINKCFHCTETFLTQESLIEHLYEVLDKKAKTQKNNLDTNCKIKSNINKSDLQVSVSKKKIMSTDEVKCGAKILDTNCLTETISIDSCEAISIEEESCSEIDNQTEVICDSSRNEALQCSICSYYFEQQRFYELHMKKKHKIIVKQINVVKFNPKCVFCSNIYASVKKYNVHLHHVHSSMISNTNSKGHEINTQVNEFQQSHSNNSLAQQQQNTALSLELSYDMINDNPILFKSVLFKCLKCEIHFLSVKLATSHSIHSEILINWKCSLCKIFFKRSDEDLHLKQHKYTASFTVINVGDTDLCRTMIKCAKCPLHISKNDFRQHFSVCGESIDNTWHCNVCDINIDGNMKNKRAHNIMHSEINNKKSDFIIINDSIMNTKIYSREDVVQDLESKEITLISSSLESNGSEIDNNYSSDELSGYLPIDDSMANTKKQALFKGKRLVKSKSMLKNKSVNKNKSQISMANDKLVIEDKFTRENSQNKLKRKLDKISDPSKKSRKELFVSCSADDDFYSKFVFKPPDRPTFLLNLTYCKNCECFINFYYRLDVDVHLENRCNNLSKRVCNVCGIVFTPKIIESHKEFHELNPHLKLQDFRFYDIETRKQILPPIPIFPKCDICEAYFVSKDEIRCHNCKEIPNLYCDICDKKFASEDALNLHIPFHGYYLQSKPPIIHNSSVIERNNPVVSKENSINLNSILTQSLSESHNDKENHNKHEIIDLDDPQISDNDEPAVAYDKQDVIEEIIYYLYTCEICNVTVGHYDELIEHCHSHYNNGYKYISTEKCFQCNLIFERSSLFLHNEIHKTGVGNESFEIFVCDLFYFGLSNEDWLNHVFKSLPESERENIIKHALYKNECRVKLDVAQKGDQEFTVYQCSKCSIFIDDSDIFTHREKCKGSNRKYPCDYCGIALLSPGHRTRHLELHKGHSLSINCYRIVVFNRSKDKTLNDSMLNKTNQYVMNKCRNCHGVVEWRLMKYHQCKFNDLKKCNNCGLLIYNKDYDKHESKHKTSNTFIASNMKVVMFGQISQESKENNDIVCSFSGISVDFTFYKCTKCYVCIRNLRPSSRHFCLIDAGKWKCSRCHLFFDEGQKKGHRAMHVSDTEFTSDYICVIPFDPQETYQILEKKLKSKGNKYNEDRNKDSKATLIKVSVQEKTDTLYRCTCGLHYLTEENAREHVEKSKCGVVAKKKLLQTCSKCNLNFTPEILYKHLLQHHADKHVKYSFDIVNVSEQHLKDKDPVKINSQILTDGINI